MTNEDRILDRIRKLMAKAESTTPEEAEALVAKAKELMESHRITNAILHREGSDEGIIFHRIPMRAGQNLVKAKRGLLQVIAEGNSCQMVFNKQAGWCEIIGFKSDTELVEVLYTSLLLQMQRAMNHALRTPSSTNMSVRKNNFAWGFVEALQTTFSQIKHQYEGNEGVEITGALVRYDQEVADAMAERYPRLRKDTGKRRQYDPNARAAGSAAGRAADTTTGNRGVNGGTRGALNA